MGNRPNAHVWFGIEAVEDCPFAGRYDDDGEEVEEVPEAYEVSKELKKKFGVEIIELDWEGSESKFALAAAYHRTDWDDEISFNSKDIDFDKAEKAIEEAAASVGWKGPFVLKWRVAATYG